MDASLPSPLQDDLNLVDKVVAESANGVNTEYFQNYRDNRRARIAEYAEHRGNPV
jgi:hypothetical protein